jgi:hypothetical protein
MTDQFPRKLPGWRQWIAADGEIVTLGPDGRWWPYYGAEFDSWFCALALHQVIDDLVGLELGPEGVC